MTIWHKLQANILKYRNITLTPSVINGVLLLACGVVFCALAIAGFYPKSSIVDSATLCYFVVLCVLLAIANTKANSYDYPHTIILSFIVITFFMLRVLVLLFNPDCFDPDFLPVYSLSSVFKKVKTIYNFTSSDVNKAVVYLLMGTLSMIVGFKIAGAFLMRNSKVTYDEEIKPFTSISVNLMLMFFFLLDIAKRYSTEYYVIGISGGNLKFLWHFINFNTAFIVAFVIALTHIDEYKIKTRLSFLFWTVVYIVYNVAFGSRAPAFSIFLFALIFITIQGKFFKIKRIHFGYMVLLVAVSIAVYKPATFLKNQLKGREVILPENSVAFTKTHAGDNAIVNSTDRNSLMYLVSLRLGGLDPLTAVLSEKAKNPKDEGFNFLYCIKSLANLLIPKALTGGHKLFPEALTGFNRLFPYLYANYTMEYVTKYYYSQMWTLWGFNYAVFGWGGGILMFAVFGFIFVYIYNFVDRVGLKYRYLLKTWILFGFYKFLLSFGYDDDILTMVELLVVGLFSILLLHCFEHLNNKFLSHT